MSQQESMTSEGSTDIELWEPSRFAREVERIEAKLANGFLRCHPEKWLPGFSARWAPLLSAIGCEVRVGDVRPTLGFPDVSASCFKGMVGGERVFIAVDSASARSITDEVVPALEHQHHSALVVEYLAQRFIATLGQSQADPDLAAVSFGGACSSQDVSGTASIRFSFSMNNAPCTVFLTLGAKLVDKLDGLWRRQIHAAVRNGPSSGILRLEVAQLGVPPHMLTEYLSSGTVIDLEVPASDLLTLKVGAKPFVSAKMISVDGKFACQTTQGAAIATTPPEGTSRLCVELAAATVDAATIAELGQPGAIFVSDRAVDERVTLTINQEKVGEARLCLYQGRFAVEVL